jgi:hypothetical protein
MEVACMYSLFVGVDVSKDSFSVAGLNDKAKLLFSLSPLMNALGFSELLKVITSRCNDLSSVIIALESTGPYHLNLFSFLVSQGITTIVVNPLIYQTLPEEDQDRQEGCGYYCPVCLSQQGFHQPTSILPTHH